MRVVTSEYSESCIPARGIVALLARGAYGWKVSFLVKKSIDSLNDGADICFGAGSFDADSPGSFGKLPGKMNRDHQNGDLRKQLGNLLSHIQAIDVGHLEVQ